MSTVTIHEAEAKLTRINKTIAVLLSQVVDLTEVLAGLRNAEKTTTVAVSTAAPAAAPAPAVEVEVEVVPAAPAAPADAAPAAAPAPAVEVVPAAPASDAKVKGHRRSEEEIIAQVLDGTGTIPSSLKGDRLVQFNVKLEAARTARANAQSAAPAPEGFAPPAPALFVPANEEAPSVQPVADTIA